MYSSIIFKVVHRQNNSEEDSGHDGLLGYHGWSLLAKLAYVGVWQIVLAMWAQRWPYSHLLIFLVLRVYVDVFIIAQLASLVEITTRGS